MVVKGKLRSVISGGDPVKGHAADREICRGEAFGQIFRTFCEDSAPNASPLPIVPPIAKILHSRNPTIRQC
jgi:hypothetical protein